MQPNSRLIEKAILIALLASCTCMLRGQAQQSGDKENSKPAITLTPAVITVKAKPGQAFSQELTLWNNSPYELAFRMEAQDIVVRDGKRAFLPAGELQGGIARSAVFSNQDLVAEPGSSVTTRVTVTVPPLPGVRAIACIFMGRSPLATHNSLSMTASLGALVTFSLDNNFHMENRPLQVEVNREDNTITFRQQVTNSGTDPLVPQGVIAVTNERGVLVARLPVASRRLLPGESSEFTAEQPGMPRSGRYKAMLLMQNESAFFSNAAEFTIQ